MFGEGTKIPQARQHSQKWKQRTKAPILRPPDAKNWLIGKDSEAGKDWRQKEKGTTENEMLGWHHWLDGHEFEQVAGVGDGQGSLACCSPWHCKESDTTEQLNWRSHKLYGVAKRRKKKIPEHEKLCRAKTPGYTISRQQGRKEVGDLQMKRTLRDRLAKFSVWK